MYVIRVGWILRICRDHRIPLFMFVCVCVCVCVCLHVRVRVYIICVCVCVCVFACACACVHNMCMCVCVCVCAHNMHMYPFLTPQLVKMRYPLIQVRSSPTLRRSTKAGGWGLTQEVKLDCFLQIT